MARMLAQGKRVLEVACGAGLGLGYVARDASYVVGGDIDELNLTTARATNAGLPRVRIVGLDAHNLPFPDASFDLLLLHEAIYYLQDPHQFMSEAARVLSEDGKLIVAAVNGEWKSLHHSPNAIRYYSARELTTLAGSVFSDIAIYGGFRESEDLWSRLLLRVKQAAVHLHLMPDTLAARAWLKRIIYGRLTPMPTTVTEGMALYVSPTPITCDEVLPDFKILYLVAGAPRRPSDSA
ncbi:MAG: class I SAM-dependent methyltransferase [Acidobacteriales bacterium]|nr:class I SAM-dependent methyltransferase [Terriglobales bacterium]